MKNRDYSHTKHILHHPEIVDKVEKTLKIKEDKNQIKFLRFGRDISLIFSIPLGLALYYYKKRKTDISPDTLFFKYVIVYTYLGGLSYLYFKFSLCNYCEKIIFNKIRPNLELIKFFYRVENNKKYENSNKYIYWYIDNVTYKS
jgi:hypothetical protein